MILENVQIFEKSYKIICNSDENVLYMKVAQKNPMNPNTWSVHLSHASNYLNMELFPSGHLSDTGPEPGKHSRLNSPFTFIM